MAQEAHDQLMGHLKYLYKAKIHVLPQLGSPGKSTTEAPIEHH